MKIVHIITGLNNGGAEGVLYRLVVNDKKNQHIVISMMDKGKYGPLLDRDGIEVICLNMEGGRISIPAIFKLYRLLKNLNPDLIQTWMYHADLIGGIIGRLAGIKRIFWNIRHSTFNAEYTKKSTIFVAKLCGKFSSLVPEKIICCAESAIQNHIDIGYCLDKFVVIGNGYDLTKFIKNNSWGNKVKQELNLGKYEGFLLGMIGRYDPQKNHKGLIEALSILKNKGYSFKLILVGRDLNDQNNELNLQLYEYNLKENTYLLDQRNDIPAILNALDIHILSSSYGEGFPNVIAEAMVCGVACVATDIGDSKVIIGEFGEVVEPNNSDLLCSSIVKLISLKKDKDRWEEFKDNISIYARNNFDLNIMLENYNNAWNNYKGDM